MQKTFAIIIMQLWPPKFRISITPNNFNLNFFTINVTAVPMWTFWPLYISMEQKPWSVCSSCHTTAHNFTTVNKQMQLILCNWMFKFDFDSINVTAVPMLTWWPLYYFYGAENHEVLTVAALPQCTILRLSINKCY